MKKIKYSCDYYLMIRPILLMILLLSSYKIIDYVIKDNINYLVIIHILIVIIMFLIINFPFILNIDNMKIKNYIIKNGKKITGKINKINTSIVSNYKISNMEVSFKSIILKKEFNVFTKPLYLNIKESSEYNGNCVLYEIKENDLPYKINNSIGVPFIIIGDKKKRIFVYIDKYSFKPSIKEMKLVYPIISSLIVLVTMIASIINII